MSFIKVVAHIKAKPGHEDACKKSLVGLTGPTREEKGCIAYDLFQVKGDVGHFVFVESWTSEEDLFAHFSSEHLGKWIELDKERYVDSLDILTCVPVDVATCCHHK